MTNTIDILAIGAHPDDVEIGMAGTLALHQQQGYKTAICALTKAELSSNGTVESRQDEAEKAAALIGATERIQLDFPDRGLAEEREAITELTRIIRRYKPTYVFVPWHEDRHPDHGACGRISYEAVFNAKIRNYKPEAGDAHSVAHCFYYMINSSAKPHFVLNVSEVYETKRAALSAYQSQFSPGPAGVETPLTNQYVAAVEARDRKWGSEAGVTYAEGFISDRPLPLNHLGGLQL
ncbi:bacillithiol biosynthesis deacetylase BshB1 [Salsuginibacillus kocurii]|uniref:bacillithiol biosynthesis deacetylase BshB1 n=1 Tax=Salsuginibacillus kocurii TaxID=427078 RepID=UPI000368994F|nr:bacillithiol biosynthesis deacetylase BshB1 [Salsuginibacillus kocurii]